MTAPDEGELRRTWERALRFWALAVFADVPVFDPKFDGIAAIDLSTRVVVLNPRRLDSLKAWPSLEAILVHELGHHVRYPHTLATLARLELMQRELLPVLEGSLLNLFTDLLINTELGRDHRLRDQLCAVYRAMPLKADDAHVAPEFVFHLLAHEEAYRLQPGALTGKAGDELERRFPGARAEAQQLVEQLPNLAPNPFTQFICYASVLSRYLPEPGEKRRSRGGLDPIAGDLQAPSAGDYADALERSQQEAEAIARAVEEGWIDGRLQRPDATSRHDALPGVIGGKPHLLAEAMAIRYRRMAEKYLLKPTPEPRAGDPYLKTTLLDWEDGDAPQEIDWLATFSARGPQLGVAMPLKRELEADPGGEEEPVVDVRLELYLDVSGSMPDPKQSLNPMTLAAQVLAMSAFRAKGRVRGLIYSTNHLDHWAWTRSATSISNFLMSYIGGGTTFPFDKLRGSLDECRVRPPIRVVLTDQDFFHNVSGDSAWGSPTKDKLRTGVPWKMLVEAARVSPCVVMLNGARGDEHWVKELGRSGARIVPVPDLATFPAVAVKLGEALFGDGTATKRKR